LYTLDYLERRKQQQLADSRLRLQRQAKVMNLDRFDNPDLLQARAEADTYSNLRIFEPYPEYDPLVAYTPNQVVWWNNGSYRAIKNNLGINPNSRTDWEAQGSHRGYYRDQTSLEHLQKLEYLRVQNELLGPTWRDIYLKKNELSEAESLLMEATAVADRPGVLFAYRTNRIPRIQAKSVALGVTPGLLIDDTDI
jgi:hypothetical protein